MAAAAAHRHDASQFEIDAGRAGIHGRKWLRRRVQPLPKKEGKTENPDIRKA
jgi:hypothetical protein